MTVQYATPLSESILGIHQSYVDRECLPCFADLLRLLRQHPKWIDDEEALKKLKGMRYKLEQRTTAKIITPTQALKLPDLTEIQTKNIEKLIYRGEASKKLKKVKKPKISKQEMFQTKQFKPEDFE